MRIHCEFQVLNYTGDFFGSSLHLRSLMVHFILSLQLTDGFVSPNARRKVLAGIVMTSSADDDQAASTAKVISLGTGTKCINGEYMSDKVKNGQRHSCEQFCEVMYDLPCS